MTVDRRLRFIYALVAWLLGTVVLLTAIGRLEPELLFPISVVGLFVVIDLTAPVSVRPQWRKRLWGVILLGIAVVGLIVLRETLETLPEAI